MPPTSSRPPPPPSLVAAGVRLYLAEASVVALLMMAIGAGALILEHPSSALRQLCQADWLRRLMMGTAVGLVVVGLTYCPWGQLSGAHLNPAVSLALARADKLAWPRLLGYVAAQVGGALCGMGVLALCAGSLLSHPQIGFITTTFDPERWALAFAAEATVTFVLMTLILACGRHRSLRPWTGVVAGVAMVVFVLVAAPISGVSMNPARSLAAAVVAGDLSQLWLYVVAPPTGTLLAAEVHLRLWPRR